MRAVGATEDEIQQLLKAAVVEVCKQVDDADDRAWLVAQFRASLMPLQEGLIN